MYVIRYKDLKQSADNPRKLVKLCEPTLWKAAWPEGTGDWQAGHEIRSDSMAISLFVAGTTEAAHYHERCWELYQVLEGSLRIAVKPFRMASWSAVTLACLDMLLLAPGTPHLVDSASSHVTQVIQAPPASSDKVVIQDEREIREAMAALKS